MKYIFAFMSLVISSSAIAQKDPYLLIGTYTSGKSEGIYVYTFNSRTAANRLISTAKVSNPSYLAVSPNQQYVYSVEEDADASSGNIGGNVSAFSFNPEDGQLTALNKQFSGGKHPCYVAVDKSGKWVFAGNYSSGNAAVFPVGEDGSLAPYAQLLQHTGSGPDAGRQEAPHVHSTILSKDNKYLFVPDLGIDKVMIYRFNQLNGKLSPAVPPFASAKPGGGPRHFDFHPNNRYAYLMEEMTATVAAFQYTNGKLKLLQRISALPKDFKGSKGSADIHVSPDGKFLYCSNRGDANSIAIFSIQSMSGKLTLAGYQSTLGKTPRNFNFDPSGNFLLVANQNSDEIVVFKINKKTGLLTDTGTRINVPNPVCIKWITRK